MSFSPSDSSGKKILVASPAWAGSAPEERDSLLGLDVVFNVVRIIFELVEESGYRAGLVNYSSEGLEKQIIESQGVLVLRPLASPDPVVDIAQGIDKPIVTVPSQPGRSEADRPPSVSPDARKVTWNLLEKYGAGANRVLFVTADFDHQVLEMQEELINDWSKPRGITVSKIRLDHMQEPVTAVRQVMQSFLEDEFDLIAAATGSIAIAAQEGAALADASPRVLALVDSSRLDFMEYPISSVRYRSEEIGEAAARMLIGMIEDPETRPLDAAIEASLVERR